MDDDRAEQLAREVEAGTDLIQKPLSVEPLSRKVCEVLDRTR